SAAAPAHPCRTAPGAAPARRGAAAPPAPSDSPAGRRPAGISRGAGLSLSLSRSCRAAQRAGAIDPLGLGKLRERFGVGGKAQRLLGPQAQETATHQRLVENPDRAVLQPTVEIDQHIP